MPRLKLSKDRSYYLGDPAECPSQNLWASVVLQTHNIYINPKTGIVEKWRKNFEIQRKSGPVKDEEKLSCDVELLEKALVKPVLLMNVEKVSTPIKDTVLGLFNHFQTKPGISRKTSGKLPGGTAVLLTVVWCRWSVIIIGFSNSSSRESAETVIWYRWNSLKVFFALIPKCLWLFPIKGSMNSAKVDRSRKIKGVIKKWHPDLILPIELVEFDVALFSKWAAIYSLLGECMDYVGTVSLVFLWLIGVVGWRLREDLS